MHAIGGPDAVVIRTPVRLKGADFRTSGRFTVAAGETVPFVLTCFRSHLADPAAIDPEAAAEGDRRLVAQMGRAVQLRRALARPGGALADHAEGADPCGDGRDRGGADHLAARGDRRRPQLGLPLLLAARRDLHALRAAEVRLPRRGGGLAALAAQGGGGLARADAAALRHRRRAAAARARARLAPGLRRQPSGPHRQPGADPGAARRARRDDGRPARRARAPARPARRRLAAAGQAGRVHGEVLDRPRPRHLGDARAAAALHPLQGDGLGGARPGDEGGDPLRAAGAGRPLAGGRRPDPRRGLPRGVRRGAAAASCSTTAARVARRGAPDAAAGRLPAARGPADRRHGQGDPGAALRRRAGAPLRPRRRARRDAGRRGGVPRLLVLARRTTWR